MSDDLPDDATEIVDAQLPRADLVKAPAHGMPFFIAKSLDPQEPIVPDVAKSDAEDTLDTAVAAPKLGDERPSDAPGDPDDPTSAAWEAVDAAGGRAAVNQLVALKDIVAGLLQRESVEDFAGSDDDACENTYDLDSVLSALDFALGVLAPFAVTEQAEADDRAEDALIKASAALVETVAAVAEVTGIAKAGRVLSATNEAAIRGAVDSLTKVLDSLPAAKEADVTKADETVEPDTDVVKSDDTTDVTKADGDMSSLSDADLKRLAITGQDAERTAALQEIGLRSLTGGDVEDADVADDAEDAADDADTTQDTADVDASDAGVGTDDMTKSTDEDPDAPADAIQKALADQKTEFTSVVKALQDRIDALEQSPAPSRVLSNGATPPEHLLRGQDTPDGGTHVAKAVEIAKGIEDPDERQAALTKILTARYTA